MTQPPLKLRPQPPADETSSLSNADRRRSPWRRRLVEAERRLDGRFPHRQHLVRAFLHRHHPDGGGVVIGISLLEWGLLLLSLAMVFSMEMFHLAMRAIFRNLNQEQSESMQAARRIATAGVFFAILGALSVVSLIFIPKLWDLLNGN